MQPLIGLPKTAEMKIRGVTLKIQNHRVDKNQDFFGWLVWVIDGGYWNEAVTELVSNGFKFGGVMQQCITEMQENPRVFVRLMLHHYQTHNVNDDVRVKFSKSKHGKEVITEIINMIHTCNNWTDFGEKLKNNTDFHKQTKDKILIGIME